MAHDLLAQTILRLLQPRSWREKIRLRITGGYTLVQLYWKLSPDLQQQLQKKSGSTEKAYKELEICLLELYQQQQICRKQIMIHSNDGRGVRKLLIDLWNSN